MVPAHRRAGYAGRPAHPPVYGWDLTEDLPQATPGSPTGIVAAGVNPAAKAPLVIARSWNAASAGTRGIPRCFNPASAGTRGIPRFFNPASAGTRGEKKRRLGVSPSRPKAVRL